MLLRILNLRDSKDKFFISSLCTHPFPIESFVSKDKETSKENAMKNPLTSLFGNPILWQHGGNALTEHCPLAVGSLSTGLLAMQVTARYNRYRKQRLRRISLSIQKRR